MTKDGQMAKERRLRVGKALIVGDRKNPLAIIVLSGVSANAADVRCFGHARVELRDPPTDCHIQGADVDSEHGS